MNSGDLWVEANVAGGKQEELKLESPGLSSGECCGGMIGLGESVGNTSVQTDERNINFLYAVNDSIRSVPVGETAHHKKLLEMQLEALERLK